MQNHRCLIATVVLASLILTGSLHAQGSRSRILELLRQRREKAAQLRSGAGPQAPADEACTVDEAAAPEVPVAPAAPAYPLFRDRGEIVLEATGRSGRGQGARLVLSADGGIKEETSCPKLKYDWLGRVPRKTMINLAGRRSRRMQSYIKGQTAMFALLGVAGHKILQKQKDKAKIRAATQTSSGSSAASALASILGGGSSGGEDSAPVEAAVGEEEVADGYTDDEYAGGDETTDDGGYADDGSYEDDGGYADDGGSADDGGYEDDGGYADDGGYEDDGGYADDGGYEDYE